MLLQMTFIYDLTIFIIYPLECFLEIKTYQFFVFLLLFTIQHLILLHVRYFCVFPELSLQRLWSTFLKFV